MLHILIYDIDHSKSIKNVEKWGVPVAKPYENGLDREFYTFGGFKVTAFALKDKAKEHWTHSNSDGSECPVYGFYIKHDEIGKMVYITDTRYCLYRFKELNHILLGVNYSAEYVKEDDPKRKHLLSGHMSVEEMEKFIEANNSDSLKTLLICHLSKENSNCDEFVGRAKKLVNKGIYVDYCRKGLEVEL